MTERHETDERQSADHQAGALERELRTPREVQLRGQGNPQQSREARYTAAEMQASNRQGSALTERDFRSPSYRELIPGVHVDLERVDPQYLEEWRGILGESPEGRAAVVEMRVSEGQGGVLVERDFRSPRYREIIPGIYQDLEKINSQHLEEWHSSPGERPVKVIGKSPPEQEQKVDRQPAPDLDHVNGYFTQVKWIAGKTPEQMEKVLGLKPKDLEYGAIIQEFKEFPRTDQFEVRGYTNTPGGKPYQDGGEWPSGDGARQYLLKEGVHLPARVIATVEPKTPFHLSPETRLGESASELEEH